MNELPNAPKSDLTSDLASELNGALTRAAREHYRPEPLTRAEQSRLLARVDERLQVRRARRSPLLAWGGFAVTAVVCVFALTFDSFDLDSLEVDSGRSPAPQRGSLDSVLIPSEAYVVDLGGDFEERLPADYAAIEMLLLAR